MLSEDSERRTEGKIRCDTITRSRIQLEAWIEPSKGREVSMTVHSEVGQHFSFVENRSTT